MTRPNMPACTSSLVIFGGTGDLSRRKLIPALARLLGGGFLPGDLHLVVTGRKPISPEAFRRSLAEGLQERTLGDELLQRGLNELLPRLHYVHLEPTSPDSVSRFFAHLREFEGQGAAPARLFYLSVPPDSVQDFLPVLQKALERDAPNPCPSRVLVEKPFGSDLKSAQTINRQLLEVAREEQIFRIDHYLGKEAVQNILVLRFANLFLEPIWNRNYIEHVQISFAEKIGVGTRAGYFDNTGILNDVLQNHLLQVLCLIAMEAPGSQRTDSIRQAKLRVLQELRPFTEEKIRTEVIRGQYGPGIISERNVPAYRHEDGVPNGSKTETYIALKTYIDSWRWHQVPFFLRAGKRLSNSLTEVAVVFRRVPHVTFPFELGQPKQNVLLIRVQPDESVIFQVQSKAPGMKLSLATVDMDFSYQRSFGNARPDAYERLLLDALHGDNSLFLRNDEIEHSWEFVDPITAFWKAHPETTLHDYAAGTDGPKAAQHLLERDNHVWRPLFLQTPKQPE